MKEELRMVRITKTRVGEQAVGNREGYAERWVKRRTSEEGKMAAHYDEEVGKEKGEAAKDGLKVEFLTQDAFAATVNDPDAITQLTLALDALNFPHDDRNLPMRGSEDFGRFGGTGTKSAMMFLGSGEKHPQRHNPTSRCHQTRTPQRAAPSHQELTGPTG